MNNVPIKKTAKRDAVGFSLVELMVALALSMILLLGVVSIYTNSKQTYNVQEGMSRLQENVRFAMGRLTREISASGYLGCLESARAIGGAPVILNTLTLNTGLFDFVGPVTGTVGGGKNGSDVITINRAIGVSAVPIIVPMKDTSDVVTVDSNHPEYAKLSQGDILVVADCSRAAAFMVTNSPAAGDSGVLQHATGVTVDGQSNATTDLEWIFGSTQNSLATLMRVKGNTYTIDDSARGACSAATPGYCALTENGNELVEGVESMTVSYGIDTGVDSAVDQYVDANAVADWNTVVSVRITLVVNEVERVQGSNNGLTNGNPKTFVSTIRIRSRGV